MSSLKVTVNIKIRVTGKFYTYLHKTRRLWQNH